ncbi:hypothetical protein GGR52DRAFT_181804 [Hypoxylon sp. FL1284]|nr:hypothetical protein GGR52DRAFT_181804 [Hypoxylon sp. FL1284]
MQFSIISLLAFGAIAAAAPSEEADCPRIRCIDAVNKCGIKYGRCYDMCSQGMPSPPPCPDEPTSTTALATPSTTPACSGTATICTDILETCGSPATATLTYGGCFPECGPTPTFTPPPCPTGNTTSAA